MPLTYTVETPKDLTVRAERPLTDRLRVPAQGASEVDLLDFAGEIVPPMERWSAARRRVMMRAARNLRMVDGDQWLQIATESLRAGASGYQFVRTQRESTAEYPMPVDNRLAPAVINELSRLTRREYVPTVEPLRGIHRIEGAASAAKRYLLDSLRRQKWEEVRLTHARETFVCGTSGLCCSWDDPASEFAWSPLPTAQRCGKCGATLAQPMFEPSMLVSALDQHAVMREQAISEIAGIGSEDEEIVDPVASSEVVPMLTVGEACPWCGEGMFGPMGPGIAGPDIFGRDTGEYAPRGTARIEHVSIFEMYPYNDGVSDPAYQPRFGVRKIRDCDWLGERYPQADEKLTPENHEQLRRFHPLLGDASTYWGGSEYTEKSFRNHREECRVIVEPRRAHPDGRLIVTSGDLVLADEPLQEWIEREVPGYSQPVRRPIRRVTYGISRFWEIAAGWFWGTTPVNDGVRLQWRLNELDAQWVDARERGGPVIVNPPGVQIDRGEDEGGFRVLTVTGPLGTDAKNVVIPSQPITGNVYAPERDNILQSLRDCLGPHEVEAGENPAGVTTATQLMILNEETAKRRETAERSLIGAYEVVWSALLALTWGKQTWEDEYETETAAGRAELKRFKGEDLAGQCGVKVTKSAGVDHSIYEAQATKDGLEAGIVQIDDPTQRVEVAKALKIPSNLNEGVSLQVRRAEEAWMDFVVKGEIPTIDPTLHDASIRFGVLGRRWEGDDGAELQKETDWAKILREIADWPKKLREMEAQDAALKTAYGPLATQPGMVEHYEQTVAQATAAAAAKKLTDEGRPLASGTPQDMQAAQMQAMQMVQLPEPPGEDWQGYLPATLQERVFMAMQTLARLGEAPNPVGPLEEGEELVEDGARLKQIGMLRMYATLQAYRLLAQPQEVAPAPPPPGGNVPPGAPPAGTGVDGQ